MKNKKIVVLTVIVIVMSLIIGIGIGLNLSNKKVKINNNDENQEVNIENSNEEIEKPTTDKIKQEDVEKIINEELKLLLTKKSLNELTNQDKLQIALDLYVTKYGYSESISKNELEYLFKNSSLKNLEIDHENIYFYYMMKKSDELLYEIKGDNYVKVEGGHGAPILDVIYKKVIDYKEESDKIKISYKYAFYRSDGDGPNPIDLYPTYEDAINSKNKIITYNPNDYVTDEDYSGYQSAKSAAEKYRFTRILPNLDTYTYTFKIDNDKLVLLDFEKK